MVPPKLRGAAPTDLDGGYLEPVGRLKMKILTGLYPGLVKVDRCSNGMS